MCSREGVLRAVGVRIGPEALVRHRADDGQFVSEGGCLRQQRAELDARDAGRDGKVRAAVIDKGFGLGVPGVDVRKATLLVEDEDAFGGGGTVACVGLKREQMGE